MERTLVAETAPADGTTRCSRLRVGIALLGVVSLLLYAGVLVLSMKFTHEATNPPLLEVLALLAGATVLYFLALGEVLRQRTGPVEPWLLRLILGFAVLYRLVLLPSLAIEEIDYYRYLWDGRVTLHGANPYSFSPSQVQDVELEDTTSAELNELYQLSQTSAAVQTIFARVHYRDVPTAYPPLAQGVFAATASITPAPAPLWLHILILKGILVGFDLATLGMVVVLLRQLRLPESWCLAYGWCPLGLKEFANSGHLDSIAVFLTVLAVYCLVRVVRGRSALLWASAAMGTVGLAVLAKSYPVILLPVAAAYVMARLRWRGLLALSVAPAVVLIGYLPFMGGTTAPVDAALTNDGQQVHNPASGLGTFLRQWETNDLVFMLVYHNLRYAEDEADRWYVWVPRSWRATLSREVLEPLPDPSDMFFKTTRAFVLTQVIMGGVLLSYCLTVAWRTYRRPEPETLVRSVFLTLAVGWLLSSAQNPWYLLWSLPFMVFDGRRSWFLLTGLVLLYYLGAKLETGAEENLVWLEYAPFFVVLGVETWWQGRVYPSPPLGGG